MGNIDSLNYIHYGLDNPSYIFKKKLKNLLSNLKGVINSALSFKNLRRFNKKNNLFLFLAYIFFIFTISSFSYPIIPIYIGLIFLLFFLLTLVLIISKFAVSIYGSKNNFFTKGAKFYNLFVNSKFNFFTKQKNIGKKFKSDQIFCLYIFVIIPLLFIPLLSVGVWQDSNHFVQSSGYFLNDSGFIEYQENGDINIKFTIDSEFREKISYMVGRSINIPLLDICFENNGSRYGEIFPETFESKILIEGEEYFLKYNQSLCIPLKMQSSSYSWFTNYESKIIWKNISNKTVPDYSSQPDNHRTVKPNYFNLFLASFVLILFWDTFWVLALRVFKYIYNGLELKKGVLKVKTDSIM